MDPVKLFWAYAAKFEETYMSDDWSILEPFFCEDAIYETVGHSPMAGTYSGRDAIFKGLKRNLDTMDRRFQERRLELITGPEIRDGAVWIHWRGTYRQQGLPDLCMEGAEMAWITDDRITKLQDTYTPAQAATICHWWSNYEQDLPPAIHDEGSTDS